MRVHTVIRRGDGLGARRLRSNLHNISETPPAKCRRACRRRQPCFAFIAHAGLLAKARPTTGPPAWKRAKPLPTNRKTARNNFHPRELTCDHPAISARRPFLHPAKTSCRQPSFGGDAIFRLPATVPLAAGTPIFRLMLTRAVGFVPVTPPSHCRNVQPGAQVNARPAGPPPHCRRPRCWRSWIAEADAATSSLVSATESN